MIGNDPAFIPNLMLPKFDLDDLVANQASQASNKTSSQMSPLGSSQRSGSGSSGPGGFPFELDIHHSESPGPHGSLFGLQGLSSTQKSGGMAGDERLIHPNEEMDFGGAEDWGIEIDENGNIIENGGPAILQDELELPPLPHIEEEQLAQQVHIDDQGDVLMMGEEPLPEAEAFPQRQEPHSAFPMNGAPAQRAATGRGRKRHIIYLDEDIEVPRKELRDWQSHYLENCGVQRPRPVTVTQAKNNAIHLTFGLGIGNIGQNLGIPGMIHPLALQFSGDALYTTLTGFEVPEQPRGRRRSASEAIEGDEPEVGRRVKPRLDEDNQNGQGQGLGSDDFGPILGDSPPEVGRDAQDPMPEHMSSALQMPWNRGSSAVPSSIRAPGSAKQGHQLPSSPLKHHGEGQDIVRFSDDIPMSLGGDDLDLGGGIPSNDDSFEGLAIADGDGQGAKLNTQEQDENLRTALDIEGRNFLSFIESAVQEHGERREDDDVQKQRRWIAFDDLFLPRETDKTTAAQAFYHALSLATKDQMFLQQDGAADTLYGGIWLGLKVSPTA